MRALSVLMHCVYYPPEIGGLESHVSHLCEALVRMGHQVRIVTSRSQPGLPRHETVNGVEIWRTWLPARHTPGWAAHALASLPIMARLGAEADVVHAQDIASVPPGMVARRRRGAPLVVTWHTSHFLRRANSPLWAPVFRHFISTADYNLAASREIADVAEALAPGTPVEALTNGVETDEFAPGPASLPPTGAGRQRIIVPRRLFEKNGVEYFVRALPLLDASIDAVIVGDGPERARLEQLAHELGVRGRVEFLGARPNDEMPGLLRSASLAVFPSLMEATSVAALECLSCGVPVAASRVGGLPEIVDDMVGGLFEPANPGDLARVVNGLLARADLHALGQAARRRVVDHWSNRRLAERHVEIYQSLLRPSPHRRSPVQLDPADGGPRAMPN